MHKTRCTEMMMLRKHTNRIIYWLHDLIFSFLFFFCEIGRLFQANDRITLLIQSIVYVKVHLSRTLDGYPIRILPPSGVEK